MILILFSCRSLLLLRFGDCDFVAYPHTEVEGEVIYCISLRTTGPNMLINP